MFEEETVFFLFPLEVRERVKTVYYMVVCRRMLPVCCGEWWRTKRVEAEEGRGLCWSVDGKKMSSDMVSSREDKVNQLFSCFLPVK